MTEKLNKFKCRCGAKWGMHNYPRTPKEKIDNECCVCSALIVSKLSLVDRFEIHGNYCSKCIARTEKDAKNRIHAPVDEGMFYSEYLAKSKK